MASRSQIQEAGFRRGEGDRFICAWVGPRHWLLPLKVLNLETHLGPFLALGCRLSKGFKPFEADCCHGFLQDDNPTFKPVQVVVGDLVVV